MPLWNSASLLHDGHRIHCTLVDAALTFTGRFIFPPLALSNWEIASPWLAWGRQSVNSNMVVAKTARAAFLQLQLEINRHITRL
jgi:hypothetical protein